MLSLEEEGAYIRLLAFCWQHGSIPADPEQCAKLIGKGSSTNLVRVVQQLFELSSDDASRMVHERLDEERVKQAVWREKCSGGGKKSAENRKNLKGSSTTLARVVGTGLQLKGNSSSSSSSSSTPISPQPPAPPSLDLEVETLSASIPQEQIEVASWFGRRPTTEWSEKELKAWGKIPKPIDPDDWKAIRWYYTQSGCAYLRKDLVTLLNNWTGEIDRAKNYDPNAK